MRSILASALFTAAALLANENAWAADAPPAAPPAPAQPVVMAADCGCCPAPEPCRRSHLEFQVHAAMLTPDPEGPVGLDTGGGQVTWDSVDYDPAIGGRVAWTFPMCSWDVRIAGTYWGKWDADSTTSGTFTTSAGTNTVTMPLHEEATGWDIDLTFLRPLTCSPCFTSHWGVGLRWLHFDEQATAQFTPAAVIAVFPTVVLNSDIDNDLFAAEVVADGDWKRCNWHVTARGSLFAGWMHRQGDISASGIAALTGTHDETDDLGFGGEIEVALVWHPSSCWALSIGYGLLALGNVTRAHEAFDFSNTASNDLGPVFSDDTLLVHRVFVGVGFDF